MNKTCLTRKVNYLLQSFFFRLTCVQSVTVISEKQLIVFINCLQLIYLHRGDVVTSNHRGVFTPSKNPMEIPAPDIKTCDTIW